MEHCKYWKPSLSTYWNEAKPDEPHPGFPCFIALLYRSVKQGQEGEEDPSHILDNVLFKFPSNVPNHEMQALVGGLITFTTFSRLNLDRFLTSISWSQSTIAVESMELEDGDFLIFALKIPKFFSPFSVKSALRKTIQALKLCNEKLNRKMSSETALSLREFFQENSSLIELVAFPTKEDDPFSYAARPASAYASKAATCLATQLFEFARQISPLVLGSAIFTKTEFILSEIKQPLLDLLTPFGDIVSREKSKDTGKFYTFPLWINFKELGWSKEEEMHTCSLSVVSFETINYYVLLDSQDSNISNVHSKLLSLLTNGIADFSVECESIFKEKFEGPPAVVYWPDTGAIKTTSFDVTKDKSQLDNLVTMQKFAQMHDEFAEMKNLKELSVMQHQKYITGIKLPKVETIMEVKGDANLSFIEEAYQRLKDLIPNLPADLSSLYNPKKE